MLISPQKLFSQRLKDKEDLCTLLLYHKRKKTIYTEWKTDSNYYIT